LLKRTGARADSRALLGAVAIGSAMGLVLGGSYLAGGAARAAMDHTRLQRLAAAAKDGFSDQALLAEASTMDPGALAVARRHDPFTAPGWAERDWETNLLAARLGQRIQAGAPLLRADLQRPAAPLEGAAPAGTSDLDCLTKAVYYEARGESRDGQAAVAQVVMNRVRSPRFPKTVCGVVFQGAHAGECQFSFACDGSMRRPREAMAWRRARTVAARALGGFVMQEVGNATHYHVAGLGAVWGAGLMRVAQIGAHVFYKFSGRGIVQAVAHPTAPDNLVAPPDAADKPVYANGQPSVDGGASPKLILASATTAPPAQPGIAPPAEAATAEKPRAAAGAPADKSRAAPAGEPGKAKPSTSKPASAGAAPLASAAPGASATFNAAS
jgi:spore germination cell wall hydrolase CwlJ-like protein